MNVFIIAKLSRWVGATLTLAPDDSTAEDRHGTECFEVLQKANAIRRLSWPTGANHQTSKWVLVCEIFNHGWPGCNTALSAVYHPYIYPKVTDKYSNIRRLLKNDILYVLFSGFVILATVHPALLLRLILCSVCTLTMGSPSSKIMALISSNFTNFQAK